MVKNKKTFSIISLGCFRNNYDSEIVAYRLAVEGYRLIKNLDLFGGKRNQGKLCDLLAINTCGFIEQAKKQSLGIIQDAIDLKNNNQISEILIFGCLVKRYSKQLKSEYPEVDCWQSTVDFMPTYSERKKYTDSAVEFLKICEGCTNNCSFCAIPLIKGPLKSRPAEEVIKEVKHLDKQRIKELNIIGQDITAWGKDLNGNFNLTNLLKQIIKQTKSIPWIRLVYTHPKHFSNSLIELIAKEKRICKYIDLPIQHINDKILTRMNRGTTKQNIVDLINKIRTNIPGCVIRTSVIVGFPGETEKQFKELLSFLRQVEFERLGAFIYSREEGTTAFSFPKQVHYSTKKRRLKEVMIQQKDISQKLNQRLVGKSLEVLVESKEDKLFVGRTQSDAVDVDGEVFIKRKGLKLGNFYKVKITDALEYDLIAE